MTSTRPVATVLLTSAGGGGDGLQALLAARWIASLAGGPIESVALWGGRRERELAHLGPVHAVNGRPADHVGGFDVLATGRPTDDPAHPVPDLAGLVRSAGSGRLADAVQGRLLRRRLARGAGPIWVTDPSAARLVHYVPDDRVVATVVSDAGQLDEVADADDRDRLLARTDVWVAGGPGPAEVLADLHLDGTVVALTAAPAPQATLHRTPARASVLAALGAHPGSQLVTGYGELDWWSEPDLFPTVLWNVLDRAGTDRVTGAWLAGASTDRMLWPLRHDLAHAGIVERVRIVSTPGPEPLSVLSASDVVLWSRPRPTTHQERAELDALGAPVVRPACVDEEPHRSDAGIVVRPLDDRALAQATVELLGTPGAREAAQLRTFAASHAPSASDEELVRAVLAGRVGSVRPGVRTGPHPRPHRGGTSTP